MTENTAVTRLIPKICDPGGAATNAAPGESTDCAGGEEKGYEEVAVNIAGRFLHLPDHGFAQGCYPLHQSRCILSRWWDKDEAVNA